MADTKISNLPSSTTPLAGTEVVPLVQSGATKQVSIENLTNGRTVLVEKLGVGTDTPNATPMIHVYGGTPRIWAEYDSAGSLLEIGSDSASSFIYNRNNQPLDFGVNNALKWQLTTAGSLTQKVASTGIDFTANTPASGMTSQLLNWYEEGTWTPVAYGTTSAGTGTYVAQSGKYTRIGNSVHFTLSIAWTAHSGTGDLRISGLPFTSDANGAALSVWSYTLGFSGQLTAYVASSNTFIVLEGISNNAASTPVGMDTNVGGLNISGCYFI
jgi:hypothetical protein